MKMTAKITLAIGAFFGFLVVGCGGDAGVGAVAPRWVGDTIGSLTETFVVDSIPVEGYGVVGALAGTGSSECPPQIKNYLKKYILSQSSTANIDVDGLLRSRDTSVVYLRGIMPASVRQDQRFDVKVLALVGTQTRSLEGGWLYSAELRRAQTFGVSTRYLAKVEGAVFIDTVGAPVTDKRSGYILGGGNVRDQYRVVLSLRRPDYLVSRKISNIINTRFGDSTARAVSAAAIELTVPIAYADQKERFIAIVQAIYVSSTEQLLEERTSLHVNMLANSENKFASEVALEAIGHASLAKLSVLLNSANEEVRLRAGRCVLNLGGDGGLGTLRAIALEEGSKYRVESLEALSASASRADVAGICRRLLQDKDFDIRLAASDQLRKLDDITIFQEAIGGRFYLEQIAHAKIKEVYVSRSGTPRIVLFGAPIMCRDNLFIQTSNGEVTINAPAGQEYVTLIRKLPKGKDPVRLKSTFDLSDIIRKLCEEPLEKKGVLVRAGLNVPYAQAIGLVKQLCDSGAAPAEFHSGKLPEIK